MARRPSRSTALIPAAATAACGAGCAHLLGIGWPWGWLASVNVVAMAYYGWDKWRSVRGGWRVPEAVLLGFAAVGGAAGSLAGQIVFHHKTSKRSFRRAFWAIVIVQAAIIVGLITRFGWPGEWALRR